MNKLCKDCQYFKISYEPQRIGGQLVDFGQARCDKYNLVTDFVTHKKFEKLTCQYEVIKGGKNEDISQGRKCI